MTQDPGVGRTLGDRYELVAVIGRGGMAEVWEATDTRLGRRVAIKILRPDLARDPAFQDRFRREAQSSASLNHPNIVRVYGCFSDKDNVYIMMEYMEEGSLYRLCKLSKKFS